MPHGWWRITTNYIRVKHQERSFAYDTALTANRRPHFGMQKQLLLIQIIPIALPTTMGTTSPLSYPTYPSAKSGASTTYTTCSSTSNGSIMHTQQWPSQQLTQGTLIPYRLILYALGEHEVVQIALTLDMRILIPPSQNENRQLHPLKSQEHSECNHLHKQYNHAHKSVETSTTPWLSQPPLKPQSNAWSDSNRALTSFRSVLNSCGSSLIGGCRPYSVGIIFNPTVLATFRKPSMSISVFLAYTELQSSASADAS